jgi:hypothetical protein
LNDGKLSSKPLTSSSDNVYNGFGYACSCLCRKAKKKNAARCLSVGIDELTEIFIFSYQETLVVKRSLHDAVVFFPRRNFSNGQDIVPGLPESENNAKITAFIG